MASLELDHSNALYQIRAYQAGMIQVQMGEQQQSYTSSLIITPTRLTENWRPQNFGELTIQDFQPIQELNIDILLLGTGAAMAFLPLELRAQLLNYPFGIEVMSTSAASRTFNALSAEGRNVAAALIVW